MRQVKTENSNCKGKKSGCIAILVLSPQLLAPLKSNKPAAVSVPTSGFTQTEVFV